MKITARAKVTGDSKSKLGKIDLFQNYQISLQSGCTAIVNPYPATATSKTTKPEETVPGNSETP
jgi:hypothetical protein